MKYFHVRVSDNSSHEFVVRAENNDAASAAVEDFIMNEKKNPNVVPFRTDTSTAIDTSETDIAGWNDAVKKNRGKK